MDSSMSFKRIPSHSTPCLSRLGRGRLSSHIRYVDKETSARRAKWPDPIRRIVGIEEDTTPRSLISVQPIVKELTLTQLGVKK
jgi:hypothetical protein